MTRRSFHLTPETISTIKKVFITKLVWSSTCAIRDRSRAACKADKDDDDDDNNDMTDTPDNQHRRSSMYRSNTTPLERSCTPHLSRKTHTHVILRASNNISHLISFIRVWLVCFTLHLRDITCNFTGQYTLSSQSLTFSGLLLRLRIFSETDCTDTEQTSTSDTRLVDDNGHVTDAPSFTPIPPPLC